MDWDREHLSGLPWNHSSADFAFRVDKLLVSNVREAPESSDLGGQSFHKLAKCEYNVRKNLFLEQQRAKSSGVKRDMG